MTSDASTLADSVEKLRQWMHEFLWRDRPGQPFWKRAGIHALQIAYAVIRDLGSGQLSLRAMSLVYYTVIAMVPLLALTFSVLKGLGVHNTLEPTLLGVLEPFLGEYGVEITDNVVTFVDNIRVDVLSFVSLGILLYTVLTMMQKMEEAFNYIWSVSQARSLASRVSEYLFAIIVVPLLILISVGIASYVNTNFFVRYLETLDFGARVLQFFGVVTPFLFMSLAFALAYRFIPNTRVQFSSALIGGVVTTIAWQTMSWVFRTFIVVESANAVIYAAFFAVILLMLFIYLGWFMLLIGSSVAFYHQYPSRIRTGRKPLRLSISEQEEITLTIAALIIKRFENKQRPWSLPELIDYTHINSQIIESALTTLLGIGFIYPTADEPRRYLPANAVEDVSILELRQQIRDHAIDQLPVSQLTPDQLAVRRFLEESRDTLEQQLGQLRFTELVNDGNHSGSDTKGRENQPI